MLKKRSIWVDRIVCFFAGFLFAWLTIWATYMALEQQSKAFATDLQQIKRILFLTDSMDQERLDIIEWNERMEKPNPTVVVAGEEEQ